VDSYYLYAVILLAVLALTDLMVGVSNDAVNFLTAAVGSKAASLRTILIVASIGVFVGASFSSGMMEIARKGIFVPSEFYFNEIIIIFLATMITDIILLDAFNSLGMPTSTTVSIVFELLGASVIMAILKVNAKGDALNTVFQYINTDKAITIILGILLSVVVAFSVGALVQYISRLLFSFEYERRIKFIGSIWGGISFTILSYFMIIKGLKGASFVTPEFLNYVKEHTLVLLFATAAFWILLFQLLIALKVNILKIIVLFGTFTLAMAFAGNDLVNFIGVPIAGYQAYEAWSVSNVAADALQMDILGSAVKTPSIFLFIAGGVMVFTLWSSKKARSVIKTSINLSRQNKGEEQFKPHQAARIIVKSATVAGSAASQLIPHKLKEIISVNFIKPFSDQPEAPAFDLIRASVNLVVASLLIAIGTNLKLPLSTTYVSFMVVMGTSLADKAWGKESAVYRVSGVINVISGWFLTALIAFSVAGGFAYLMFKFGGTATSVLALLAFGSIVRTTLRSRKKNENDKNASDLMSLVTSSEKIDSYSFSSKVTEFSIQHITNLLDANLNAYREGNTKELKRILNNANSLKVEIKSLNGFVFDAIQNQRISNNKLSAQNTIQCIDFLNNAASRTVEISTICHDHLKNLHHPLNTEQLKSLTELQVALDQLIEQLFSQMKDEPSQEMDGNRELEAFHSKADELVSFQTALIGDRKVDYRNADLYLALILQARAIAESMSKAVYYLKLNKN